MIGTNGNFSESLNLNIQDMRDRNISINLIQYRNLREDDPDTRSRLENCYIF